MFLNDCEPFGVVVHAFRLLEFNDLTFNVNTCFSRFQIGSVIKQVNHRIGENRTEPVSHGFGCGLDKKKPDGFGYGFGFSYKVFVLPKPGTNQTIAIPSQKQYIVEQETGDGTLQECRSWSTLKG